MAQNSPDDPAAVDAILTKGTEPAPAVLIGAQHDPMAGVTAAPSGAHVLVAVTPTQVRRPWRATVRTGVQALLAFATLVPFLVGGVYQDGDYPAIVAQVVAVSAGVSRVMALPQVDDFLRRFAPFLSAAGR